MFLLVSRVVGPGRLRDQQRVVIKNIQFRRLVEYFDVRKQNFKACISKIFMLVLIFISKS